MSGIKSFEILDGEFCEAKFVLLDADDDQHQLAARRAAALALSEHINASLLEPPLVE